jgi:hypothetical protein
MSYSFKRRRPVDAYARGRRMGTVRLSRIQWSRWYGETQERTGGARGCAEENCRALSTDVVEDCSGCPVPDAGNAIVPGMGARIATWCAELRHSGQCTGACSPAGAGALVPSLRTSTVWKPLAVQMTSGMGSWFGFAWAISGHSALSAIPMRANQAGKLRFKETGVRQ